MGKRQSQGAALLRIVLGAILVMHGYRALAIIGWSATADFIARAGWFPPALTTTLAGYLIVAHLVGGALLILGVWTEPAALAQLPIMATLVFFIHSNEGFFIRAVVDAGGQPAVGGYEYALLILAATISVSLLGAGDFALNRGSRRARRLSQP
jgi:putative oxidoreductase